LNFRFAQRAVVPAPIADKGAQRRGGEHDDVAVVSISLRGQRAGARKNRLTFPPGFATGFN